MCNIPQLSPSGQYTGTFSATSAWHPNQWTQPATLQPITHDEHDDNQSKNATIHSNRHQTHNPDMTMDPIMNDAVHGTCIDYEIEPKDANLATRGDKRELRNDFPPGVIDTLKEVLENTEDVNNDKSSLLSGN